MNDGIPQKIALRVIALLHGKGFAIDSDVASFGSYTKFGESIVSCEAQLRSLGYDGGELRSWSTSFKGPPPAYGAYDVDFGVSDEEMLRYASIVGGEELPIDLTVDELRKYHLALSVTCRKCEHTATLRASDLEIANGGLIGWRHGVCTKCGCNQNQFQVEPCSNIA